MKPSYAVSKAARKSSRFYNDHRHVHAAHRPERPPMSNFMRRIMRRFGNYAG